MLMSRLRFPELLVVMAGALALGGCNSLSGADDIELTDDDGTVAGQQPPILPPMPQPAHMGCAYPGDVSYGVSEGQTVPATLTWQGYRPYATEPDAISVGELFDCDGDKGVDAVMFETTQYG